MEGHGSSSSVAAVEDPADFVNRLPPGYKFHPTDDEIVNYYLTEKISNPSFVATAIAEVDLNKCEPWDLPEKAKMGEKEWYFFCQRDRKYPTGMRTNRATEAGYWKATGKDREICRDRRHGNGFGFGMKKTLVFYQGRAPKGTKTNWVMHEYRLDAKSSHHISPHNRNHPNKHEEWVVCRIFYKRALITKSSYSTSIQYEDDHKVHFNDFTMDVSSIPPPLDSISNGITGAFPCIDSPSMDPIMFNQNQLIQYQLPIIHDPLFQNAHNSSVRSNIKKETTPWYENINYDEDSSIVGGTISESELDNLWN